MTVHWPLFDLRLTTPDLVLRPVAGGDLGALAELLPDDVELNPAATTYPGLSECANRAAIIHQGQWESWGSWRPEEWALTFAVFAGEQLVGSQSLEGSDFITVRTVDSASWLATSARGQGWGQQMREAVLALAFGSLGARFAITSAWHDNHASLGVSRALGYLDNGQSLHHGGDRIDTLVHLRLTREDWLARQRAADPLPVTLAGFGPCRPFFGLAPTRAPEAAADLGGGRACR